MTTLVCIGDQVRNRGLLLQALRTAMLLLSILFESFEQIQYFYLLYYKNGLK